MKKLLYTYIILLTIFILIINTSAIAEYKKYLETAEITITSSDYSEIIATVETVSDRDNTFNVTITNNNSYSVQYKIQAESELYNITYNSVDKEYETILANTTQTVEVTVTARDDVIYENMEKDSNGNLYKTASLAIQAINPYNDKQIQIATGCTIYIEKSIKNALIAKAGNITHYDEGHTFSGPSTSSESGLCSIVDPVSKNTIYFYRGNVINNYVSFANKTWRILRINSDGSLRLILDSIATTSQYQDSNTPPENTIESAIEFINWEDSAVYTNLQNWYNANIATNYSEYIIQSEYVFDTSYQDTTSSATGTACYYFGPYTRVGVDGSQYKPTFSYTDESLVQDYVGLISADEILYAGGYWGGANTNTSFFLYNSSLTTPCWTMSPSFWDNSAHYKIGMCLLNSTGYINDWPDDGNTLTSSLGIRPVISIKGDMEMSGEGTSSDPYKYN